MSAIKKFFFFSLFVFSISILFWGVYVVSFKKSAGIPEEIARVTDVIPEIITEKIEDPEAGTISIVSDETVVAPTISPEETDLLYYSSKSNQIMHADFDGENSKAVSEKQFSGITNASWSLDKSKALLKTKDISGNYANYFYDIKNDSLQELSRNIYNFAWQTNADRIFYEYFDKDKKTHSLNVSDPNGKNWQKLTEISYPKVSFHQVPKIGLLSFWNSGNAYYQTKFQTIPLVGGEAKTIFENGFGADYLWDYAGDYILVSQSETKGGYKMQLAVMNYNGGEYRNLDIPTFSSKCAWSKNGKTVFYALPGEIPNNSILPNDYKEGKFNTADTFWKVDIKTGKKERLVDVEKIKERYDAKNLFLNNDESILFFVNKIDGKLYRVNL